MNGGLTAGETSCVASQGCGSSWLIVLTKYLVGSTEDPPLAWSHSVEAPESSAKLGQC